MPPFLSPPGAGVAVPVSGSPADQSRDHRHAPPGEHNRSLRDYLAVVRRRKLAVIVAAVVVPLAAAAYSLHQQTLYSASSEVLLGRGNLAYALTGTTDPTVYLEPDRIAQTQAELARVPAVAGKALAAAGVPGPAAALLSRSSVTPSQNADLLVFSVTDHDPAVAMRLATEYGKAFVSYREQLDTASPARARAEVAQRIRSLGSQGGALYQSLVEKEQELATMEALQTANASLVDEATAAKQVQPRTTRNFVLALLFGLVLGIGAAFLWEALDTRVRTSDEISERLGLPLLARLPAPSKRLRQDDRLVMIDDPSSPEAEAFRMLRTNIELVQLGEAAKTILVTSAVEREGKSTTAANLAVSLARAGKSVVLLDLDLRRPTVHRFFELGQEPGLTQVVLGQVTIGQALVPVSIGTVDPVWDGRNLAQRNGSRLSGRLCVLPAGTLPPNPGELAGSAILSSILDELSWRFDVIVVDSPPALRVGDALALSRSVDAVLLVTRAKVVRRPMLAELRRLLEHSGASPLGFVVTGSGSDDSDAYAYGYGYDQAEHRARPEGMQAQPGAAAS
jgi:Mrp family chromosome partitioning ATPase/capsular polysaccharide biosynthesis protein